MVAHQPAQKKPIDFLAMKQLRSNPTKLREKLNIPSNLIRLTCNKTTVKEGTVTLWEVSQY
jgi:hypothetical protein